MRQLSFRIWPQRAQSTLRGLLQILCVLCVLCGSNVFASRGWSPHFGRVDPRTNFLGYRSPPETGPVRAVVQRVSRAQVRVGGRVVGSIAEGFLVLIGVEVGDGEADTGYIA